MRYEILPDIHALSQRAAQLLARCALDAVGQRGRFCVALSGGSTPAALFRILAEPEHSARLPWSATHLFWVDERCVPPDHPDSNYGMARRLLISHLPHPLAGVQRMRGELDPQVAADQYQRHLTTFLGEPPVLDLVLLGMGADGHTASLFPGTAGLSETGRWVIANHVPQLGAWRLTLTLPAINLARQVVFLVAGKDKAPKVGEVARAGTLPALTADRPPAAGVRDALWLLDEDAAGEIPGR